MVFPTINPHQVDLFGFVQSYIRRFAGALHVAFGNYWSWDGKAGNGYDLGGRGRVSASLSSFPARRAVSYGWERYHGRDRLNIGSARAANVLKRMCTMMTEMQCARRRRKAHVLDALQYRLGDIGLALVIVQIWLCLQIRKLEYSVNL